VCNRSVHKRFGSSEVRCYNRVKEAYFVHCVDFPPQKQARSGAVHVGSLSVWPVRPAKTA